MINTPNAKLERNVAAPELRRCGSGRGRADHWVLGTRLGDEERQERNEADCETGNHAGQPNRRSAPGSAQSGSETIVRAS